MNRTALVIGTAVAVLVAALAIGWSLADEFDERGPVHHRHMTSGSVDDDDQGSAPRAWSGTGMHGAMGAAMVASEEEYLTEMVAHHQDAITAARELSRSDRPQMRSFGAAVVTAQSAQVAQMERWLAAWYPDAEPADYEPMMRDLSGLSGDELDRTFLADMVPHHMMAVMMSQQVLNHGLAEHPGVAALARDISTVQRAEIVRMLRWERVWFGVRGPMGMAGHGHGAMMHGWGGAR